MARNTRSFMFHLIFDKKALMPRIQLIRTNPRLRTDLDQEEMVEEDVRSTIVMEKAIFMDETTIAMDIRETRFKEDRAITVMDMQEEMTSKKGTAIVMDR